MIRSASLLAAFCLFSLSAAAIPVNQAKTPRNLQEIGANCLPEREDIGCTKLDVRSAQKRFTATSYGTKKKVDNPTANMRVFRSTKTGGIVYGVELMVRNTTKKRDFEWLIEPEWSELTMVSGDLAFGRNPGTGDLYKIDTVTGKTSKVGSGSLVLARSLNILRNKEIDLGENHIGALFLGETAADGTLSVRILDASHRPAGTAIDRVVPTAQLPRNRSSIELFEDSSLLVHRLDANGRIYDQIFDAGVTEAMTPPMQPLLMVRYSPDSHYMFFELDRERRLFWPVRGADAIAKPFNFVGLRPVPTKLTTALEPMSPEEVAKLYVPAVADPSPHAGDMPVCMVGQPGCDIEMLWAAIWDIEGEGIRMQMLAESHKKPMGMKEYLLPDLAEIAESQPWADTLLIRKVEGLTPALLKEICDCAATLVRGEADGKFHVLNYRVYGVSKEKPNGIGSSIGLESYLDSETEAMEHWRLRLASNREAYAKREAEKAAALQAEKERKAAELAAAPAKNRADVEKAIAQNNYWLAMHIARRKLNAHAVYTVAMRSIRTADGNSVGPADVAVARQYATPEENALLDAHMQRLSYLSEIARAEMEKRTILQQIDDLYRADRGPVSAAPNTYSSSSSSSTNTALSNAQFESKMNYLQGNTSQYMCGSSSFCD